MAPEPASVRKLNRDGRADVHYARRAGWLRVRVKSTGAQAFGIQSLSDPQRFYLCDGFSCTCPDQIFSGLSHQRIGRAGSHLPCSHIIAVQRVLEDALRVSAAVAEPQPERKLRLVKTAHADEGPE